MDKGGQDPGDGASGEASSRLSSLNSQLIREELVQMAAKFLSQQSVSPVDSTRSSLESMGFSNEEIEEVFRRVPGPSSSSGGSNSISVADFEKLDVLGSGNGGTVYKVRHKITADIYALKTVKAHADPSVSRQLQRETEILRRTDSPYIVRCHGISERPFGEIAILMEHMDGGTLESLRGRAALTERQLAGYARQILAGLSYLHAMKIVHRDIKPANLLLNSKNEVKIADFGVSKIIVRSDNTHNTYIGTYAYMSPERINSEAVAGGYSDVYAGDIWSFGLTMLELYLGRFPLLEKDQSPDWLTLMNAICFSEPPQAPEKCSGEFRSFIDGCLQKDWSRRSTAQQLLSHPFLREDPESE